MIETQYLDQKDNLRERRYERAIRDFSVNDIVDDPDFTHCITINFNSDIAFESNRQQHNFLSSFCLLIQQTCLKSTKRQLMKIPLEKRMKFRSIPEDYAKVTDKQTARHFNIQVAMPLLDDKMNQFKIRHEANDLAREILNANICNFHIERIPTEKQERKKRISYDYKNGFRPNSFDSMKTERDFINKTRKKPRTSAR